MSPADAADLLGVAVDASIREIQRAFTQQARLSHPDLMAEASEAERHEAGIRFAELRSARDVLMSARSGAPPRAAQLPAPVRTMRPEPMRGPWSTFIVFLLLAALIVTVVTVQDSFRSGLFEDLRGVTVEVPRTP